VRPGFGELETIQEFMIGVWGMTTDHVPDVQFGHFVSAEVEHVLLLSKNILAVHSLDVDYCSELLCTLCL